MPVSSGRDHGINETAIVDMEAGTVNDTHFHEFNAKSLIRSGDTFTLASGTLHSEVVGDVGVRFLVGRKWTSA